MDRTTPGVTRETFGRMSDGREVEAITLRGEAGVSVRLISLGAAIQSVWAPDRNGEVADVALGFRTLEDYLSDTAYFGATVGRLANRLAGGRFSLDGVEHQVGRNDGDNSLHGGAVGFDKAVWEVVEVTAEPHPRVVFRHVSPDGDQGYPGTLTVTATYALEGEALTIDYAATTDRPTVVNLSNHAYWNLAGEGSADGAMGHRLTVPADTYLPTDAASIPTGEFRPVEGTPFDFREPVAVGQRVREAADKQIRFGRGYDHCWVVSRERSEAPRLAAVLEDPGSGRVLEVLSDQPGLQVYSGNFLDGTVAGKSGRLYRQGDCVVLEPQMFPDTPNQPEFGSLRLDPGQAYRNRIVLRFSVRNHA